MYCEMPIVQEWFSITEVNSIMQLFINYLNLIFKTLEEYFILAQMALLLGSKETTKNFPYLFM